MKIAVAGGTGVLGRHIVEACRSAGHEVRALSRRTGSDLTTGEGLDAALDGVQIVVDASNTTSQAKSQATAAIARRGDRLRLVTMPIPGRAGNAMRSGGLLPPDGARLVGPTFEEWLAGDDVFAVGR